MLTHVGEFTGKVESYLQNASLDWLSHEWALSIPTGEATTRVTRDTHIVTSKQ